MPDLITIIHSYTGNWHAAFAVDVHCVHCVPVKRKCGFLLSPWRGQKLAGALDLVSLCLRGNHYHR